MGIKKPPSQWRSTESREGMQNRMKSKSANQDRRAPMIIEETLSLSRSVECGGIQYRMKWRRASGA